MIMQIGFYSPIVKNNPKCLEQEYICTLSTKCAHCSRNAIARSVYSCCGDKSVTHCIHMRLRCATETSDHAIVHSCFVIFLSFHSLISNVHRRKKLKKNAWSLIINRNYCLIKKCFTFNQSNRLCADESINMLTSQRRKNVLIS